MTAANIIGTAAIALLLTGGAALVGTGLVPGFDGPRTRRNAARAALLGAVLGAIAIALCP